MVAAGTAGIIMTMTNANANTTGGSLDHHHQSQNQAQAQQQCQPKRASTTLSEDDLLLGLSCTRVELMLSARYISRLELAS